MFSQRLQNICDQITACVPGVSFPVFDGKKEATDVAYAAVAPAFHTMHDKVLQFVDRDYSDAETFSQAVKELKNELSTLEKKIDDFRSLSLESDKECGIFGNNLIMVWRPLREQGKQRLKDEVSALNKEYCTSTTLMADAYRAFDAVLDKEKEYLKKANRIIKKPESTPADRTACIAEWVSYVMLDQLSKEANVIKSAIEKVEVDFVEIQKLVADYDTLSAAGRGHSDVLWNEIQSKDELTDSQLEEIDRLAAAYFRHSCDYSNYTDRMVEELSGEGENPISVNMKIQCLLLETQYGNIEHMIGAVKIFQPFQKETVARLAKARNATDASAPQIAGLRRTDTSRSRAAAFSREPVLLPSVAGMSVMRPANDIDAASKRSSPPQRGYL
ncbi:MAG TPA: hypothetical protein VNC84_04450 [Gammaproteobacteria bacterium]|nr:hypothetical protein [Gammaproteobacteria bacterium]